MNLEEFSVYGISDRTLRDGRVRFLLFFEADEPYTTYPAIEEVGVFSVFDTPNGFHIIGHGRGNAEDKRRFFEAWKRHYPRTDYRLQNENVLAPHSKAEADYLWSLIEGCEFRIVRYYRDKKVFERYASQ